MSDELRRAIAAWRAGRRWEARNLIEDILVFNPKDELAWLWYVEMLTDAAQRVAALQACLESIPNSAAARKGLEFFTGERKRARRQQVEADSRNESLFAFMGHAWWLNRDFHSVLGVADCEDCGSGLGQCQSCRACYCFECLVQCPNCGVTRRQGPGRRWWSDIQGKPYD